MLKSKIFIALVFVLTFAVAFSGMKSRVEAHSDSYFGFDNCELLELGSKAKYRCKICGREFGSGLVMAGHIRGNHNKWLIHKYYEKI